MSTSNTTLTVAFLGASAGVGLAALKHTLAAGHTCIALCRDPAKLTTILPESAHPNLRVLKGNAHDLNSVKQLLVPQQQPSSGSPRLVDTIVTSIGAKPELSWKFFDDPQVCQKGMATLLTAITQLRAEGAVGKPHVTVCGTTGMSKFGRDYPILLFWMYQWVLKVPHKDKEVMEDRLVSSGEDFTIVHCSLLTDGGDTATKIRVGVEDPKTGLESRAIGYTISREDAGKWFAENLVLVRKDPNYLNKIAAITY